VTVKSKYKQVTSILKMKGKITKRDAFFFFLGALAVGLVNFFLEKNGSGKSIRDHIRDAMNKNRTIY